MAEKPKKPRLTTATGIACFEHVWEPHAMEEGKDKKYSIVLCWTPESVKTTENPKGDMKLALKELKAKCIAAATEKFTDKVWRGLHEKGKFRFPWRDGDEYEQYDEPFTKPNAIFAQFQSNSPPGVVDRRAKPITDRSELYSGCLVRVTYACWAYDSNGNKGVTLLLNNVQKVKDGTRLSGKPSAEDDFEGIEGDDDDDGTEDDDLDI